MTIAFLGVCCKRREGEPLFELDGERRVLLRGKGERFEDVQAVVVMLSSCSALCPCIENLEATRVLHVTSGG